MTTREVTHFQFLQWPERGAPSSPDSLLLFLFEARPHVKKSLGPVVVHCSPGTGRTGTVVAIDVCMRAYEENQRVDVVAVVNDIRRDRAGAVQTKDQFRFIYAALAEYATRLGDASNDNSLAPSASVSRSVSRQASRAGSQERLDDV